MTSKQEEYKKLFFQEADDFLQQMNKNLLVLEKDAKNIKAIDAIFRAAHTLKSMSASMGYEFVADLSHKMEDLLAAIRTGSVVVSEEIVDCLFSSFDHLDKMIQGISEGKKPSAPPPSLEKKLITFSQTIAAIPEERVSKDLTLTRFEKHSLFSAGEDGKTAYLLKVLLEENCALKSARAFMLFRHLHALGEVLKAVPQMSEIEKEKFDREFSCVLVTDQPEFVVQNSAMELLEIEAVEVKRIEILSEWGKTTFDEIVEEEEDASLSQEVLRTIQTVRVDVKTLDKLMNLVEELAITKLRLFDLTEELKHPELNSVFEVLHRITEDLQTEVMKSRLVPVSQVFDRFPRLVRDLAKKQDKKVSFRIEGGDIELDRTVLDKVGDCIVHLLKNAVDHGIEGKAQRTENNKKETAQLTLLARREKSHVYICVKDDGRGMDKEAIKKAALLKGMATADDLNKMSDDDIFLLTAKAGFSTKETVTEVSGRGVGLDVVKEAAENIGGHVLIESQKNVGTQVTLRLPLTTAVVKALLVSVYDRVFALPISNIVEIVIKKTEEIKTIDGQESIQHRDKILPIIRLEKTLLLLAEKDNQKIIDDDAGSDKQHIVVIVEFGSKSFGVVVQKLINQQDIVIKQLTKELKGVKGFAGATILGDGSVALVLDVATLV